MTHMEDKFKKLKTIYDEEGTLALLQKSKKHILNKYHPKPAVANNSTRNSVWFTKYLYSMYFDLKYGSGTDVMDEEWDTLILLDACRFDDFSEVNTIEGDLQSRISKGVDSNEFIRENFLGNEFADTVYVTANPHVSILDKSVFHDIITEPISDWDFEYQCVKPETVTKFAKKAHQMYPHKRIIVHYMQPHDPPLGPIADDLRSQHQIGGTDPNSNQSTDMRIMELVADGKIDEKRAHLAYRETLQIVLSEVTDLLEDVSGKVVISSDHGEMFGEDPYPFLGKLYEHYKNPKTIELCKVPWLVVENNHDRREINKKSIDESKQSSSTISSSEIEEQLEALGYK